jgi:hypothetical protein
MCLACQQFSHIYRRPRGLIISYPLRDSIAEILRNRPNREVDVIVVTAAHDVFYLCVIAIRPLLAPEATLDEPQS